MKGLVLEGGGARGAYQAGAILAFNKRGIKFDAAVGTSIGAVNAAFYAAKNIKGMKNLWLRTDCEEMFGFESEIIDSIENLKINKQVILDAIHIVQKIIKNKGIDISKLKKILDENLDETNFRESEIDFGLTTFNITNMKPIKIMKNDIPLGKLNEYILASAYLPCFKFEKIIDSSYYLDGGVFANCPVNMFADKGYEEIYVIRNSNDRKIKYDKTEGVKLIVIGNKENLGLILNFSPKNAKKRMKLGYYDTLKVIDNLDGDKYYFKNYSEKYYTSLFTQKDLLYLRKKYVRYSAFKTNKKFILKILEEVCKTYNIKRFTIYDIPFLIIKLKYTNFKKKNNEYKEFIDKINIKFM